MGGNSVGTLFTVTTFGESHGPGCGALVDGCPAGVNLEPEDIARELRRRRPGGPGGASPRNEADEPEILSGVFEGKTLGTPIAILVRNQDQRSGDYDELKDLYRPGHADWTWEAKYGLRDHRGGGRSSGRETVGRVAAGAVAKAFLAGPGILIRAWTSTAGGVQAPGPGETGFDFEEIRKNPLGVPHRESAEKILARIEELKKQGDSAGGVVTCMVTGLPPGLGDPVFGKLDARIAGAMLSIGAVKGVELGSGFAAASSLGSINNDEPVPSGEARPPGGLPRGVPSLAFRTNHAGGVLGGISTGSSLEFRVAFKPVPSISQKQRTVDRRNTVRDLVVRGRHDVCIVSRAIPVVEAMTALVLADLILLNRAARI
ncbi:MAG: chorismate synthase [Spirochaetaceae bacterium]|jgi:chorismate synthase|nr:chorismate synthase [Spirochaetaceae bacterium]